MEQLDQLGMPRPNLEMSHATTSSTHPPQPDQHTTRILVVDDDANTRQYLELLLGERWVVETVADGAVALAAVRDRPPDLVLTDVMMPGFNGFELLRALRADPRTRTLPVILLSARADEQAQLEGLEARADDYVSKPFSARELLARVDAHLELARMRREIANQHALLQAVMQQLPAGVVIVAPSDKLLFSNEQAAQICGYAGAPAGLVEELDADRTFRGFSLDGQEYAPGNWPLSRTLRHGEIVKGEEIEVLRSDASRIIAQANATPVKDDQGRIIAGVVTFWDITERKQAEAALRRAYDELEQRVQERTAELWEANALLAAEIEERKLTERERERLFSDVERRAAELDAMIESLPDAVYIGTARGITRCNARAGVVWL